MITYAQSLAHLKPGALLDFGPNIPHAKVTSIIDNGTLGPNHLPLEIPSKADPEQNIPAIALAFPEPIALGENRPMLSYGPSVGSKRGFFLLHRTEHELPFGIKLLSFTHSMHPGITKAKAFESLVEVDENGVKREVKITMNHPLRIGEFTLYQSSWRFDERTGRDRSILAVVQNPVGKLPYAATILIAFGMLLHMGLRLSRKAAVALAVIALCSIPQIANATESQVSLQINLPKTPQALQQLPLQADGRIKSFDTFAKHLLLELSGRSTIQGISAEDWLTAVLLEPDRVKNLPVFLIEHPDTRDALGLSGSDRDRYSWAQLESKGNKLDTLSRQAMLMDANKRSALQRDLVRLSDAWIRYWNVDNALVFLRNASVAKAPNDSFAYTLPHSFFELAERTHELAPLLDTLPTASPLMAWFTSTFALAKEWNNASLMCIPNRDSLAGAWLSPATLLHQNGFKDAWFKKTAEDWNTVRNAWLQNDSALMEQGAQSLRDSILARAGTNLRPLALQAEVLYNKVRPFDYAMIFFWIALLPAIFGVWKNKQLAIYASLGFCSLALLLQGFGIAMRMLITLRPPVTNLYETFLFVGALSVVALLLVGHFRKWNPAIVLAALLGAVMLLLAQSFGADGDDMPVLVAVLDSNFWLTVHVLTISVGYGGVLAAGVVAHWHLMQLKRGNENSGDIVRGLLGFGLLFSFVGTLLGGVWADQSWGRFWGWDPKENGALMIVLWAAILFHAKASGLIRMRGLSVGAVLGISTVLFAWLGVNLLGVGLHSYGFTQGTLWGLGAYAIAEGSFLVWVTRKRTKNVLRRDGWIPPPDHPI